MRQAADEREYVGSGSRKSAHYSRASIMWSEVAGSGGGTAANSLWENVSLSVDLLNTSLAYRIFLQRCANCRYFDDELVLRRAVYRYENYWLPLLSMWCNVDLEPPADVHWVWHGHMVMSDHYAEYCRATYGRVLRHKIRLSQSEEEAAATRTRLLWRNEYPEERYDVDWNASIRKRPPPSNASKLSPLTAVVRKERLFSYQVSLSHYSDVTFLRRALARYKQYLLLRMLKPEVTVTLPCDVQLMRRIHALHPLEYLYDVEHFLRRRHDVGPRDLFPDPDEFVFVAADLSNSDAWRKVFGEPLAVPGTGFRGGPVQQYMAPLFADFIDHEMAQSCEITIDNVKVTEIRSRDKNVVIEARRVGENSFAFQPILRVKGKIGGTVSSLDSAGLGSVVFDSKKHRGIEFQISYGKQRRFACVSGERHVASVFFNPRQALMTPSGSFRTQTTLVELGKVSCADPCLSFTCRVQTAQCDPHVFTLDRDQYVDGPLPSDLPPAFVQSWLPWPLSTRDDTEFSLARHSLKHRGGKIGFGCQMVKLEDADMMAIFIYQNNDRLVSVAHSIGTEHLPTMDQVSNLCPVTFDAEAGDHGMLVKNHNEDWCVCVGRWESTKTGDSTGHVRLSIFRFDTCRLQTVLVRDDELQTINIDNVSIDLPIGRVTIAAGCRLLAEHVALAFAVGTLFVQCQRTAALSAVSWLGDGSVRSIRSTRSVDSSESAGSKSLQVKTLGVARLSVKRRLSEKKRSRRRKISASFTFLLACGLRIDQAVNVSAGSRPTSRRSSAIFAPPFPDIASYDGLGTDPGVNPVDLGSKLMMMNGGRQLQDVFANGDNDCQFIDVRL